MTYSVSDLLHAGSDRLRPTLPPAGTVRIVASAANPIDLLSGDQKIFEAVTGTVPR